jgi:hypothetical protein
VASPLTLALPALEAGVAIRGRLSAGGEDAVAGIVPELGPGVGEDREDNVGDSFLFLLDMLIGVYVEYKLEIR